ncbi:MAG: hypothetical protein R3B41_01300 [Candidatus Doudnabacteria bacterium]
MKGFLFIGVAASLLVAILFFGFVQVSYSLFRWNYAQLSKNGEIMYSHQDPGTTKFIEVMFGKDQLSDNTRLTYVRWKLASSEEFKRISQPHLWPGYQSEERLWTASREHLLLASEGEVLRLVKVLALDKALSEAKNTINSTFDTVPLNPNQTSTALKIQERNISKIKGLITQNQNQVLYRYYLAIEKDQPDQAGYQAFWAIMKQYGNPRIVLTLDANPINSAKYAFYAAHTNTVYIEPYKFWDGIKQEMSHSKQFNDAPHQTSLRFIKSLVTSAWPSPIAKYEQTYDIPGEPEYDAHSVIQPELESEFKRLSLKFAEK